MANFAKPGRPLKDAKKRSKRLDLRATEDEIAMLDELVEVLAKRRYVGASRMDCIMECIRVVYEREDRIRVISKKHVEIKKPLI